MSELPTSPVAEPSPPTRQPDQQRLPRRWWWNVVEKMTFWSIALIVLFTFITQFPPVQNWIVGQITGFLSKEWNTEVSVGYVHLSLLHRLTLERVYVADQQGDTLLYAGSLRAGLRRGPWSLLNARLEVDEIDLEKARFFLRRPKDEEAFNIQFILDYFRADQPKPEGKPSSLQLSVRHMHLRDVHFLLEDHLNGKRMEAYLDEGIAKVDLFSPGQSRLRVQRLALDGFHFAIAEYEGVATVAQPTTAEETREETEPGEPLLIFVEQLMIRNSRFALDRFDASATRHPFADVIDFEHLLVSDIAVEADSVRASSDLVFSGRLKNLQAHEQSGFRIEHLSADHVHVSDTLAALSGMRLRTNESFLTDTFRLRYRTYHDFERFVNRVYMEGRLAEGSKICLGDLAYFNPDLRTNDFFEHNRERVAEISGLVNGRVNRLNGRNLSIRLDNDLELLGKFDGDDLAEGTDRMRLHFNLEKARTSMRTLRQLLPGFSPPAYFNTLGDVRFSGYYDLLFGTNHILGGEFTSDVGRGTVDMKLDLNGGEERAVYSGFLHMREFNLAAWTGDDQFGMAAFQFNISRGTGLTLATILAEATGSIDSLYYRGYNYRNIELGGKFEKALFKGKAAMDDPNIAFSFDGTASFRDSLQLEFDFKADIQRLKLRQLNLVDRNWVLSAKVQSLRMFLSKENDINGAALLKHIHLQEDGRHYHVDSLQFAASTASKGQRRLLLFSEVLRGSLQGYFTLERVGTHLLTILQRHYPALMHQALGKVLPDTAEIDDNYRVRIDVWDTHNLLELLDPKLAPLRNARLNAHVNAPAGQFTLNFSAPHLRYGQAEAFQPEVACHINRNEGRLRVDLPWANLSPTQPLGFFSLEADFKQDQIDFLFTAEDTTSVVERLFLKGELSTADSLWNVHFNTATLTLFDEQWLLDEDNYIRFRPGYWETRNIYLMHDLKRVLVESYNDGRGLRFSLANFDLNFFERFIPIEGFSYRGNIFNFDGEIEDLFELRNLQVYITTDTVFVNEKPLGALLGDASMAHLEAPILGLFYFKDRDKADLRIEVGFLPSTRAEPYVDRHLGSINPGEFEANLMARAMPLNLLELIVPDISKTAGTLDARVTLGGPPERIRMNGEAWADGQFQIDYLGTLFYLPRERIVLTSDRIWADGDTLLDATQKSAAIIQGGLRHDHFRNWQADCRIRSLSSDFFVLNTREGDNELFYGQALGSINALFRGSFDQLDMRIDAVTGRNTRLYIPIGSSDLQEVNFITFRNAQQPTDTAQADTARQRRQENPYGISLEVNLSITEAAEVQLILDAQTKDIIKGRGSGDLRMVVSPQGDFNMYGTYRVQRGEYLFTLFNVVNKPFVVEQGGTISWYGDPYGAQINLKATYQVDNVSLSNFIRDELAIYSGEDTEAKQPTRVMVIMYLTGDLFQPTITFDLAFPNLVGRVKSLTDSKMSLLRQDQNELTRQVFGLIVVGGFLPSGNTASRFGRADLEIAVLSTVTQMLATQMTHILSEIASDWVGGSVSSMEFDIIYNDYRLQSLGAGALSPADLIGDIQLRLKTGFNDDRITFQVNPRIGIPGQQVATNDEAFFGGDINVEFQFTQNRNVHLRVYGRREPNIAGGGVRYRGGAGVVFRKEFDSFEEMMNSLWKKKKGRHARNPT